MAFEHILTGRSGDFATITMNRPQRRNSLSLAHMRELIMAFRDFGDSDALGIVLAGSGPVFSAGHDLAEVADGDNPLRLSFQRYMLAAYGRKVELLQEVSSE